MISSIWQPSTLRNPRRRGLIYFICGNPGCIGFYGDFLEALRGMLDASEAHTAYDIYGRNLLGFVDGEHEPFGPGVAGPWGIREQTDAIMADVTARATTGRREVGEEGSADKAAAQGDGAGEYDLVILAGHSIGAYIAVDIFDRHLRNASSSAASRGPRLRHGFLLFPTIASIGQSPSGRRMQQLRRVPTLEVHGPTYAGWLLGAVPTSAVRWVLETALGMSGRAAAVAAEWLKSRDGLRQALHMGLSELDQVREDRWDDELWGAASSSDADLDRAGAGAGTSGGGGGADRADALQTPRFFLFYGKRDHWVADHVRDEFVRRRQEHGARGGRTSIVVDEGDLPHAFCTTEHNSWVVAKRVHGWIQEIERGAAPN